MRTNRRWWVLIAAVMLLVAGILIARHVLAPAPTIPAGPPAPAPAVPIGPPAVPTGAPAPAPPKPAGLPGMPPVPDPHNIYADAGVNMLSRAVAGDPALVYVPHNYTGDVWVIDQHTFAVVGKYHLGGQLQHVAPSWDMRTLYAGDDTGNHLTAFDPATGRPGTTFSVIDPYNMYFTPDGRYAISVAEGRNELVWYDPHTWQQHDTTPTPACAGINHGDFSADGLTGVFTCEFAGRVAVIDVATHKLVRTVDMPRRDTHMGPQDIKLAPDASAYYVADCDGNGVWVLDAAATRVERFVPTGLCAHGLYLSRDSKLLFVTDRGEGSVSVLDAHTGAPVTTWHIPGGGSPDMGNLTADGTQLWLSGRYNKVVYVFSTADGHLIKKIPVGGGPHGLAVWPQPGRYSLGHTGITR